VQRQSEEALKSPPNSLRKVQEKSNRGLNEIQRDADVQQMNRPENSSTAPSIEDRIEHALEKLTNNKD
jgi:hypothetical protein